VIDAMAPAMLERAVAEGAAPTLGELMRRGLYVPDCAAAFPSVTPVCAASIATGAGQDRHLIPAMNWYHREEGRYVEYGSSFRASQRFGIARQLTDTVYNMNRAHLAPEPLTVFEALDDAGVRTAGTTYLIYRGRHRHEPQRDSALTRLASATLLRHPVMGPRELFYADIFASRRTGCRSGLGMPGVRDQHAGCVGDYLVRHDLFDFLLLSLPDNDNHSHRLGPDAQVAAAALNKLSESFYILYLTPDGIAKHGKVHAALKAAGMPDGPVLMWTRQYWRTEQVPGQLPKMIVEQRMVSPLPYLRKQFPNLVIGLTDRPVPARTFLDAGMRVVLIGQDSFSGPQVTRRSTWADLSAIGP
jgi:hypothetical protein